MVANFELAALVPPVIERRAKIHSDRLIGDNSIIEANVIVHEHANLGTGVHVIKNAEIGAFCEVRNFVQIGQNSMLGSECYVSEGAFIDKGVGWVPEFTLGLMPGWARMSGLVMKP